MKPETKKMLWESLLYLLLLLAYILLIINYILFKSDAGECVKHPKEFLLEHFEEITGGNITCTCVTDAILDRTRNVRGGGYKIIFSSFGEEEVNFSREFLENVSINP